MLQLSQTVNPVIQYLCHLTVLLDIGAVSILIQGKMISMKIHRANFSEILSNYPAQNSVIISNVCVLKYYDMSSDNKTE
jgi:hypothetical protein